jgi:hypothetical protein
MVVTQFLYERPLSRHLLGNRIHVALQTGLMEAHEGDRSPADRFGGQGQVLISGGDRIGKLLWGAIHYHEQLILFARLALGLSLKDLMIRKGSIFIF